MGYGMGYGYGGGIGMGTYLGLSVAEAFLREQQRQAYLQRELQTAQQLGKDQAAIAALQQECARRREPNMRELRVPFVYVCLAHPTLSTTLRMHLRSQARSAECEGGFSSRAAAEWRRQRTCTDARDCARGDGGHAPAAGSGAHALVGVCVCAHACAVCSLCRMSVSLFSLPLSSLSPCPSLSPSLPRCRVLRHLSHPPPPRRLLTRSGRCRCVVACARS